MKPQVPGASAGGAWETEGVVFIMRRFLLVSSIGVFVSSLAAAQSVYLIELQDHAHIFSGDRPIDTGRIVLFHQYPDGTLLSIQKGEIVRVARVPAAAPARALLPGDAIDVGVIGDGQPRETATQPESGGLAVAPALAGGGGYGGTSHPGVNPGTGAASSVSPVTGPITTSSPSQAMGSPAPMTGYQPAPRGGHR
jgi:hypothetical protein